jgi:hypothetical protein
MGCGMSKRGVPASKTGTSPERPRGGRARAVSELVPDAGRAAFRRFGFVQSAVVSRWKEIVGTRYAGVSVPESIKFPQGERTNGTLNLVVRGANATMMQHIAPEIIERVNRFFGYGAIARVQIRQGDLPPPRLKRTPPSLKPIPVDLGASLRTIADPELKAVLEALAAGIAATRGAPVVGQPEE